MTTKEKKPSYSRHISTRHKATVLLFTYSFYIFFLPIHCIEVQRFVSALDDPGSQFFSNVIKYRKIQIVCGACYKAAISEDLC